MYVLDNMIIFFVSPIGFLIAGFVLGFVEYKLAKSILVDIRSMPEEIKTAPKRALDYLVSKKAALQNIIANRQGLFSFALLMRYKKQRKEV